jgi:hypothetical protein
MSSGLDISFVEEMYRSMSDEELIRVATQDAYGLTPEAMEVVKNEIARRNLDSGISKGVEAQNKTYSKEELSPYCELVSNLPCPTCSSNAEKLNGTIAYEVMSFIVFTQYKKKLKIACPYCLDKANNIALAKSAILGWWGIPWGFIKTIQAIAVNTQNRKTNHQDTPNDFLLAFVLNNIGQLEAYKNEPKKIEELLGRTNNA